MRNYLLFFCMLCIFLFGLISPKGSSAHAENVFDFEGRAIVNACGTLVINGREVKLWGITMLAPDQQCWHNDMPWPCGEQAILALKHFAEDRFLKCRFMSEKESPTPNVQCFRPKGPHEQDVAGFLVLHGWAIDDEEESDGLYQEEQEIAKMKRRGVWSSRFQTPEDWREGIQRFVGEDEEKQESQDSDE